MFVAAQMEESAAQIKAISEERERWVQKSMQSEQQMKRLNDVRLSHDCWSHGTAYLISL
jgi:hypothetical protein